MTFVQPDNLVCKLCKIINKSQTLNYCLKMECLKQFLNIWNSTL